MSCYCSKAEAGRLIALPDVVLHAAAAFILSCRSDKYATNTRGWLESNYILFHIRGTNSRATAGRSCLLLRLKEMNTVCLLLAQKLKTQQPQRQRRRSYMHEYISSAGSSPWPRSVWRFCLCQKFLDVKYMSRSGGLRGRRLEQHIRPDSSITLLHV